MFFRNTGKYRGKKNNKKNSWNEVKIEIQKKKKINRRKLNTTLLLLLLNLTRHFIFMHHSRRGMSLLFFCVLLSPYNIIYKYNTYKYIIYKLYIYTRICFWFMLMY